MPPRQTTNWIVLLPFSEEPLTVLTPQEGVELYAQVARIGSTYHRATRQPNHFLGATPHCLSGLDFEVRAQGVIAVEEAVAASLGASRCQNCRWDRK